MGVYIKGMEMPKGIEMLVVFSDGTVHKCLQGMREYVEKGTAVPVPPHGDLIERDAAYDQIAEQEGGNYVDMDAVDMGLNETPTIIPADKEGES